MAGNQYYGKFLIYPSRETRGEVNKFLEQLPQRNNFIDSAESAKIAKHIEEGQPIYFLPNTIIENHERDNQRLEYKLMMIGILRDGSKAAVILDDIKPYFEVRVPKEIATEIFLNDIRSIVTDSDRRLYCVNMEIHKHYPFKYYNDQLVDYIRLYFNTLHAKKRCLEYFLKEKYTYTVAGEVREIKLETASDDNSCYYRKVAREYKFKLCDWNQISNYQVTGKDRYFKSNMISYTFKLSVDNFIDALTSGLDIQSDPIKYKDYLKDRSLEMSWDLETISAEDSPATGNAPMPENVYSSTKESINMQTTTTNGKNQVKYKLEDTIFMEACNFSWYWDKNPFLTINFTTIPTPPRLDCMIIRCNNQFEIIKIKAYLVERMAPEFVIAFNDGLYDWPFILRRAEKFAFLKGKDKSEDMIRFMKNKMSAIALTDENEKYLVQGDHIEEIKLEAGINVSNEFFNVPGFLCIDVRTIFRQIYPTAEKSSLNFFLAENKLGSKEDMPYLTMFRIYRITRRLAILYKTLNYEKIVAQLQSDLERLGPDHQLLENDVDVEAAEGNANGITIKELQQLLARSTDVVHYCNIDAKLCHDLLRVRNVISDRREDANLSYTSLFDALFRAGGMKVRNINMAEGVKPMWNLAISNIGSGYKDSRKYPGAWVVPPKKGLYRDHRAIKRRRRDHYQKLKSLSKDFNHGDLDPKLLPTEIYNDLYGPEGNDCDQLPHLKDHDHNSKTDRPCSGLDFSSLYPSLIMCYNISPEKVIMDPQQREALEGKIDPNTGMLYRFLEVTFRYGFDDEAEDNKELVHGWIIQHLPTKDKDGKIIYKGMGLYPYILKQLYDGRSLMKKRMDYYTKAKEFIEKVFEKYKIDELLQKSEEEQREILRSSLAEELTARKETFAKEGKPFYKWKIKVMEDTIEFFNKEFLSPSTVGRTCEATTLPKLAEEINFFWSYYNSLQLQRKLRMNSSYGELGNSLSSFFIKLCAGAVTTNGVKNIKMVYAAVKEKGCDIKYGDTDSLYISPPDELYEELDRQYEKGEISLLIYWTKMCEISMEYMDRLKGEINELLIKDNGTRFLAMDYEEVLWPYFFAGKKKYIGVQHQGIVNLSICLPECALKEFMKSKLLMIRGLNLKTRGSSGLLKLSSYEVVKEMFRISNTLSAKEIIENKLQDISIKAKEYPTDLFIKSARYKIPSGVSEKTGKPKTGNPTVQGFVKRMREMELQYPQLGIRIPEVGERFGYVVTVRYPWKYDTRGRKQPLKICDKVEYHESFTNKEYLTILHERGELSEALLQVDIDYYITHEVVGQYARFLTYHPDYDKFYNENIDEKEADKKACAFAKKTLCDFYNNNYSMKYEDRGKVYQTMFKKVNKVFQDDLSKRYGKADILFQSVNTLITGSNVVIREVKSKGKNKDKNKDKNKNNTSQASNRIICFEDGGLRQSIKNKLLEEAKKMGLSMTESIIDSFKNNKINPFQAYVTYITNKNAICKERKKIYIAELAEKQKELDALMPEFEKICANHIYDLDKIISSMRNIEDLDDEEIEKLYFSKEKDLKDDKSENENWTDEYMEKIIYNESRRQEMRTMKNVVQEIYDIFINIISIYKSIHENDMMNEDIKYLKSEKVGGKTAPPKIANMIKKDMLSSQFEEWVKSRTNADKQDWPEF